DQTDILNQYEILLREDKIRNISEIYKIIEGFNDFQRDESWSPIKRSKKDQSGKPSNNELQD
ncbi:MAG: hypothetical protein ABDH21_01300, partial [bacterium]